MKTEYPKYKQGQTNNLRDKLTKQDIEILQGFLKQCSITAGEGKLLKIERHILQFLDIIEKPIKDITRQEVDSFLIILNKSDRSKWTKNEVKAYIKKFLKWHFKDLDLIENIRGEKVNVSDKLTDKDLLTEDEIGKMLRSAQSFKEKAYLFLAFESGARPQEIINLKWRDIDFKDDFADITLYSNKTGKTRVFPVKEARVHLWNWKENYCYSNRKDSDLVFPARAKYDDNGKLLNRDMPINTATLNKMLRRLATKSGIKKNIWNYLTRHTRATRLYEELPVPIVEKLMGHTDQYKTYAHISNKKAREEMLKKIYNIEKLSQDEREEIKNLKEEVTSLKKQLAEQKTQILDELEARIKALVK